MNPETIHVMHEGLSRTVLMLIQDITLGLGLAAVLLILCGLAGAALDRFVHWRRAAPRQPAPAPGPPGPAAYALLMALAGRHDGRADSLTGGVVRREMAAILPSARKPEGF